MVHHPSLQTLLLAIFLQGIPQVSSQICYDPICRYTLEVSMQFSLIYNVTPSIFDYYDVDLEPGTDTLHIINSTFRPGVDEPIGQAVPNPLDVITLDGVKRKVFTINGQFLGPTFEFTEGSQVVFTVINKLDDEEFTIHWHGFPQKHNVWMDGVPQLTQCPIRPGDTFTYRLVAPHAGTYWYHSHVSYQRNDGLSGLIIIHPNSGPTLPYFPVMVQDWYHKEGSDYFFGDPLATPPVPASGGNLYHAGFTWRTLVDQSDSGLAVYVSGLINGRGRFKEDEKWPLTKFKVKRFKTYRFHIGNTGGEFALQLSVDGHNLVVVGVDSRQVQPITVDSILIFAGERVDIELETNQPIGRYWFRSRLANDAIRDEFFRETLAVLEYDGSVADEEPTTTTKSCTESEHCTVFNCPFKYYPSSFYSDCIHMADAKRTYTAWERTKFGLDQEEADEEYIINSVFFKGVTFNTKSYIPPTAPVYQTDSESVSCDGCTEDDICFCTHTIEVPYNKVIQFVIANIGVEIANAHPIHFHGYNFAVVHQGMPPYVYPEPPAPHTDILCNSLICNRPSWTGTFRPALNLHDPPLKDTTVLPPFGYTVLRFRSDNPGPWLIHCHVVLHIVQGPMVLLMTVAKERFPPIPVRTPTCTRNFSLSDYEFDKYLDNARKASITGEGFQKVSPHFTLPAPPPSPPPPPPPPPFPVPDVNEGKVIMTVGGVIGAVSAAFLGGILITVVIILICRCCCSCRMPMDRHHRPLSKKVLVVPSTPTYIGGGPMATYGTPIKPVSYN